MIQRLIRGTRRALGLHHPAIAGRILVD